MPSTPRTQVDWATKQFDISGSDEGFYRISGITGSGKSHLVKLFILDVLRELETNPYAKLVVYEPKREFFAWLSSLGLSSKISYFFPSDTRSVALDFTADYTDDKDGRTLAHAFYPEGSTEHQSPFWGQSLRTIYAGVYSAIRAKLGYADLRLMCLVLEEEQLTRDVLSCDPYLVQARKLTAQTGKDVGETAHNIQLTIQSRIGEMKELAAHLDYAGQRIDYAGQRRPPLSLRQFIKEPNSGILVVSRDADYKYVQDPMNAVLFLRLTQLLDKQQSDPRRKVFVVIDEFPTLAGDDRCPGVKDMFLRLRSRGARPLITDQGLTTLKPIYEGDTTGLLGQSSNVIYLRQPDDESAEDAAKDLGKERGYEKKANLTYGGGFGTISQSQHWYDRTKVDSSTLRNLFTASPSRGVEGYAHSALNPDKMPWHFTIPPSVVDKIPRPNPDIAEYDELPPETQRLRPLTTDERDALLQKPAGEEELELWQEDLNN